ncbi:T9SS type A sorting domain-containing protein [bacterium]|nr:T9SS type A sorting domain-containing protein [bacterium]
MLKRTLTRAAMPLLLIALPAIAVALEVDWFSIDGGGGRSVAGFLALTGTVGQPDAGPLEGGSLVLRGGFWAAPGLTVTDAPALQSAVMPARHRLSASAPNPSRHRTTLQFDLPRKEMTRIRVYDVAGRVVSTLVEGELDAGTHEVAWDGRDRSGARVASGVYLVRMQAGNFGATRKVTRLK